MSRISTLLLGLALIGLPAGCGTISQIHNDWEGPAIFGGLRHWVQAISDDEEIDRIGIMGSDVAGGMHPASADKRHYSEHGITFFIPYVFPHDFVMAGGSFVGGLIVPILDAPFSLVGDLILLPFSIINEIYHGGITVRPPAPPSRLEATYMKRRVRTEFKPAEVTDETVEETQAEEAPADQPPADEPPPPESDMGDDLPEGDMGDDLPEDDMGDDLPEDDMGDEPPADDVPPEDEFGDPPADDMGGDLPEDELPPEDDMGGDDIPEDDMGDDIPEDDMGGDDIPEDDIPEDELPEDDMGE